jgi:hypothetical protein
VGHDLYAPDSFLHVQRATVPMVCTLVLDGGMPGKVRPVGDDMGKR